MKNAFQSPESPIKPQSLSKISNDLIENDYKKNGFGNNKEIDVKRMEKKAVGFILATAVKSDLDAVNYKVARKMSEERKRDIIVSTENQSLFAKHSNSGNDLLNREFQSSKQYSGQVIPSRNHVSNSRVNYNAKIVYRYQFEASPPDWIGAWEGKTRKFGLPPNTSILHFAFMGGVLSRLDDTGFEEGNISVKGFQKNQMALSNVLDNSENAGNSGNINNVPEMISSQEFNFMLLQTVKFKLYRHWKNDNDCADCKICNIRFNFLKRKHHCRL